MYWQREYVREGATMTVAQTFILDLPEHGLLGALMLRLEGAEVTGFGQAGGAWRLLDEISKIEIIGNGATVIKSLTGKELQALAAFDQGVIPPGKWRNYATNTQFEYMLINFGRWLFDLEIGLDLSRFSNVQLKITNTADGTTDFSALSVSVMGYYLRDAPPRQFGGYLRTEEWQAWTTVQNETKYLILPTEHVIRRVGLQAIPTVTLGVAQTNMSNLMYDIDFSLDTGAQRVYKGGIDDLMRENALDFGRLFNTYGMTYMNADRGIDMGMGYTIGIAGMSVSKDGAASATIPSFVADETGHTQTPETYEGDSPINLHVAGLAPFCVALLRFDIDWNPLTWLDPEKRKSVKLDIATRDAATAAAGRNAVILDRLVLTP